ncbi:MAG TPA: hypothetical protein VMW35_18025 [Myxococcota bacterium]|jgi:hypothetical protein|nr:hypothetical protein [Myxococcota bacterium]
MRRILASVPLASAVLLVPRLAAACAVCGAGRDDKSQYAFLIGSIVLSVLPPAFVGGLVLYVVRRARRIAAEEAAGVIRIAERPRRPVLGEEAQAGPAVAHSRAARG